jgi:lysozyme family protein
MATAKEIIDGILGREGGYSNNPDDLGGPTMWGITEKVARSVGYVGDMRKLSRDQAFKIYLHLYWYAPGFDKVAGLSEKAADELCDTGVNCGVATAGKILQRALNLLNRQQKDYEDLTVDGQIGPGTMQALAKFLAKRDAEGEAVLLRTLNILQGARYIEITESREANETFFYGWILHRIGEV